MGPLQPSGSMVAVTAILAAFNLGFAAFHIYFWRWLHWPNSLQRAGTTNAAIAQTLNLMLTYCFAAYGGYLAWAAAESTQPAPVLLLAGAGFWIIRATAQPALFGSRSLLSRAFTTLFVLGAALHAVAYALGAELRLS